ncbi:MAG: tetratricopeptide repeat protein [Treponema sp.]|jgi:tetratricopeptide (TPR) repeat protein|nr:tetratricopeptide repeat protein [Treponema sp.]
MKSYFFIKASFLLFAFCCTVSCSSVPKKPTEIFSERNTASNQLELGNRTANQGRYADALLFVEDARRIAIGVDDPQLIIKTSITRGNILFSMGRHDEAFRDWEAARLEAETSGERDLAALANIYISRGRLMILINSGSNTGVEEIRDQVNALISSIRSDNQAQAAGYVVLGMAEKELGNFQEAERAVRRALSIHEKGRFLEEAAYDWFFIASIYSVAERYGDALAALNTAISFDRRAENGFGLASSWLAMGEVYFKIGNRQEAVAAYRRAADIYRALGLEDYARNVDNKITNMR